MTRLGPLLASALMVMCQLANSQKPLHSHRLICPPSKGVLVKMVRPAFPAEAKGKGIFGSVLLEALIDKTGKPEAVRLLSGDPTLGKAAIEAVKKWRWKPLRLNGVAVEVETKITVNFEPF